MKTNVDKAFQGPSDFSGMFQGKSTPPTPAANPNMDAYDPAKHGRWYAVAKHLNDQRLKQENAAPVTVHRNNPRYVA